MSNRGTDPVNPGKIIFVDGIKLTENADSYWYNDKGTKFDYRGGLLYREQSPGRWVVWRKPMHSVEDVKIKGADGKDIFGENY